MPLVYFGASALGKLVVVEAGSEPGGTRSARPDRGRPDPGGGRTGGGRTGGRPDRLG